MSQYAQQNQRSMSVVVSELLDLSEAAIADVLTRRAVDADARDTTALGHALRRRVERTTRDGDAIAEFNSSI